LVKVSKHLLIKNHRDLKIRNGERRKYIVFCFLLEIESF
jgi:hypothetical protein